MTAIAKPRPHPDSAYRSIATARSKDIRLLVVDDHPAVRAALHGLLEEQPDFEVVATAESAEAAMVAARPGGIDVAVVDYELGARHNGLWLSRELKRLPDPPRVLIYSAYADALLAAASVVAHADGILSKGALGRQLCEAIRSIIANRLPLPIAPLQLQETIRGRLTDDEQMIFGMLLRGASPNEVASMLECTQARLDSRLSTMCRKLERVLMRPAEPAPGFDRWQASARARRAPSSKDRGHRGGARVGRGSNDRLLRKQLSRVSEPAQSAG